MPSGLRSKVALLALLGAFLIPITTSSLRGLTHLLVCADETGIPFTLITLDDGEPLIVSSTAIDRDAPEGVCGGLVLHMSAEPAGPGRVALRLPITNNTDLDWRGSVKLQIGSLVVPVDIGAIKAGDTTVDTVTVSVDTGQTEVSGSLLIGP